MASPAVISATDVSTYIVSKLATGRHLETIKLQKLLYFCQGWSYGTVGHELFHEDMEAWKYGPVVPAIYNLHVGMPSVGADFDFGGDADNLNGTQKQLVDAVVSAYGGVNTFKLVDITHQPHTPWHDATYPDGQVSPAHRAAIPKETIAAFFEREAKRISRGGNFVN